MGCIFKIKNKRFLLLFASIAILAVACRNSSGGGTLDEFVYAPVTPDKSALAGKIGQAEDLLKKLEVSEDGSDVSQDKDWVESIIKHKLKIAIETANDVCNNPNAQAGDIQIALEELNKAYNEANTAKQPGKLGETDFSLLSGLITDAERLLSALNGYEESKDGKEVYTDTYWISAAQKQALASAISAAKEAQSKAANNLSTQDAVDKAWNALNEAYKTADNAKRLGSLVANKAALQAQIAAAKTKINGVSRSDDGSDIPKYETWVTSATFTNLQTAITAAETLMNNPHARQPAVDASVQALTGAITAFNPQAGLKPFDISQLSDLITNAQKLLAELQGLQESVDGTDVYEDVEWISASQKKALADAISTAQSVADYESITPEVAEKALDVLAVVYHNARNAKKFGTFTANKTDLQTKIDLAYEKMLVTFTSNDGFDVLTSNYWVTHEVMAALDDALISAKELNAAPYARQEAVDAEALKLSDAIAAFNPQKGLLVPGSVNITFARPGDEAITLTGAQTLSWVENTQLTVTITETFTGYQWYVDGVIRTGETGRSISLNARDFSVGAHTLTLKVMKGSVPYTKTLTFTVN